MSITLSSKEIWYIGIVEERTQAKIVDCIGNDLIAFIVEKGELGKAIGKNARNLEALQKIFKKRVKFVEYDKNKERFVKNLFKPYKLEKVVMDEGTAKVTINQNDKGKAIGKNGRNIKIIRKIAKRHHGIEVKVI